MQLSKFVKFREESFGGVLFETRSEKVYTLNQAAAAILREIAAARDATDVTPIADRLRQHFQDPDHRLEGDIGHLLGLLCQKGLIEALPG